MLKAFAEKGNTLKTVSLMIGEALAFSPAANGLEINAPKIDDAESKVMVLKISL